LPIANSTLSEKETEEVEVEDMTIDIIFCPEGDVLLSPAEVLALLPSGLVLHNIGLQVVKIGDDFVVKYGFGVLATEVHSMNFVRKHTNILVPRVHLAFRHNDKPYIVMQYVEGATLEARWNMMDDNTRTATLLQLSGYLRQLRAPENLPYHQARSTKLRVVDDGLRYTMQVLFKHTPSW
jgi:hypothetical protein